MKITTKSGGVYEIIEGLCTKTDHHGYVYSPFFIWMMKSIPKDGSLTPWTKEEALTHDTPKIGERLYIAGKDEWWLSTTIVSIED